MKNTLLNTVTQFFCRLFSKRCATSRNPEKSNTSLTDTLFTDFPLDSRIQKSLKRLGFTHASPIQEKTLPLLLEGKNVMGQAQTGTGKTMAFLLAMFQQLLTQERPESLRKNPGPRAVILVPTRELAIQVHKEAERLASLTPLKLALVFGGLNYKKQQEQFDEPVDVIIGTPGRMIDFFKKQLFHFKSVQVLILDEADRMFDLGFVHDMRFLFRQFPPARKRLNMLFSATFSYEVKEMAYEHMGDPTFVGVERDKITADKIKEYVYYPANNEKLSLLLGILIQQAPSKTIVFTNTKHAAERVWNMLKANGYEAALLSGDIPQNKRIALLDAFTKELPVLVATDVAARGLHIPYVSHVVNYDIPDDCKDYVHRVGRTARAGAEGTALSFACEAYAQNLMAVHELLGYEIKRTPISDELLVKPKRSQTSRPRRHGPSTSRPRRDGRSTRPSRDPKGQR